MKTSETVFIPVTRIFYGEDGLGFNYNFRLTKVTAKVGASTSAAAEKRRVKHFREQLFLDLAEGTSLGNLDELRIGRPIYPDDYAGLKAALDKALA